LSLCKQANAAPQIIRAYDKIIVQLTTELTCMYS